MGVPGERAMSGEEQASRLRIRDLEEGMRPRERAAAVGVETASTETLLAILLRTGGKRGQSVIELARELLDRNGGSLGRLAGWLLEGRLGTDPDTCWNVNIPNVPWEELKGVRVTRMGASRFLEHYEPIQPV